MRVSYNEHWFVDIRHMYISVNFRYMSVDMIVQYIIQ